jgi:hypothetical protein
MAALQLKRFIDRRQDSIGGVGRARHISVRQDREELGRRPAEDSWGVDIAHGAGQRSRHRLEGLFRRTAAIGLDQQNAEVSLVSVSPRQLVLEDRPHEALVEESSGPVDYVERLRLRVVHPDAARWAEDRPVGQWGPASQACLSFRPAA